MSNADHPSFRPSGNRVIRDRKAKQARVMAPPETPRERMQRILASAASGDPVARETTPPTAELEQGRRTP